MFRLLNLSITAFRLCMAMICLLSNNIVAMAYGAGEVVGCCLSTVNALRSQRGCVETWSLCVPLLYLVGLLVVPVATVPGPMIVAMQLSFAWAIVLFRLHLGWRYSCGVPTWAGLCDTGPYGIVRHPQATLAIAARLCFTVANLSVVNVASAACFTVAIITSALCEETFLGTVPEWVAYSRRVPARFLPRIW